MIRKIVHWPDPVLSEPADPVDRVDDLVKRLAADMLETMYNAPGRGLAAPQVGVPLRLFVMDTTWKDAMGTPRVFVNPEIVARSDDTVESVEGCLSIPGINIEVERAAEVTLRWTALDGSEQEEVFKEFDAVCVQHECDHLDGLVLFDRVDEEMREALLDAYSV